jgi:hypothetical protein
MGCGSSLGGGFDSVSSLGGSFDIVARVAHRRSFTRCGEPTDAGVDRPALARESAGRRLEVGESGGG